jgi:hypothetical protein
MWMVWMVRIPKLYQDIPVFPLGSAAVAAPSLEDKDPMQ